MSDISPLKISTYGMVINNFEPGTNKKKSTLNFLNLENLARNFPLDMKYNSDKWDEPYGALPGFVSKSYYKSTPESGYNYPPHGPIDKGFVCTYCDQEGPNYHSVECKRPFNTSLVLSPEGTRLYPGRTEYTSYMLVVKKSGQQKVHKESVKSEKFSDNVELHYKNKDFSDSIVRIASNGSVNVISAQYGTTENLPEIIAKKINSSSGAVDKFPGGKYVIYPDYTYKHFIFAGFRLYSVLSQNKFINLQKLNSILWETEIFKRQIRGNTVLMTDVNQYIIENYKYNSGNISSRSNRATPSFIGFNIITSPFKTNVGINKRGGVQLKMSYIKDTVKSPPLNPQVLTDIYEFLKDLFNIIIEDSKGSKYPIIVEGAPVADKGKIDNMIDGLQPQVCQDRKDRKLRPVPYSFHGTCPMPGYYVDPHGMLRPDGKYEPCCYKLKASGKQGADRYKDIIKYGYPDARANEFMEYVPNPDNLTAIYKPGTTIPEQRRFKGMTGRLADLSKEHLINCIQESGHIGTKSIFDNRDSDYIAFRESVFDDYIKLVKEEMVINTSAVALTKANFDEFTKRTYVVTPVFSDTVDVLLFFDKEGNSFFINLNSDCSDSGIPPIPSLHDTLIQGLLYPFEAPDFIFYPQDILYYNKTNIMDKDYTNGTNKDRFTGLMYSISAIQRENSTLQIVPSFDLDIINGSKYYIENEPTLSGLLFIPCKGHYQPQKVNKHLLLWTDTVNKDNLQIALDVSKSVGNRWEVSIDDKSIPEALLPQSNGTIEIPIKFTDQNKLKSGQTVVFNIMLDQVTNKITSGKPLLPVEVIDYQFNDYQDIINILMSIQNPIKKETFKTFTLDSKHYKAQQIGKPLVEDTEGF